MKKLILNHEPRLIMLGNDVHLMPGANEIEEALWMGWRDHVMVKQMMKTGKLEEGPLTQGETLLGVKPSAAIEIVANTFDMKLLALWQDNDKRTTVLRAIADQLQLIESYRKPSALAAV